MGWADLDDVRKILLLQKTWWNTKSARKSYDLHLLQEKALKEKAGKEREDLEAREHLNELQLVETYLKRQTIETLEKSFQEKE